MTTRNRPWRQEIELLQNYPKHKTFTTTLPAEGTPSAQTAVDITAYMEECNKVSLIVEDADAYIAFDEDASSTAGSETMLVPQDEGYFDDAVYIGSKISIIAKTANTQPRIRGIIWGR